MRPPQLGGPAVERPPPGHALEEHAGRRVHVGHRGDGLGPPLLGRHIGGGASAARLARVPRDAEVDELAEPVGPHDHVGGLVVAMDHAQVMRGGQPQQRPFQHGQGRLRRQRPVLGQDPLERDPVHGLHHDRRAVLAVHQPVQPRHVRAVELPQHPRLVLELVLIRLPRPGGQVLDGHRSPRLLVDGQDDPALPAPPQLLNLAEPRRSPLGHSHSVLSDGGRCRLSPCEILREESMPGPSVARSPAGERRSRARTRAMRPDDGGNPAAGRLKTGGRGSAVPLTGIGACPHAPWRGMRIGRSHPGRIPDQTRGPGAGSAVQAGRSVLHERLRRRRPTGRRS